VVRQSQGQAQGGAREVTEAEAGVAAVEAGVAPSEAPGRDRRSHSMDLGGVASWNWRSRAGVGAGDELLALTGLRTFLLSSLTMPPSSRPHPPTEWLELQKTGRDGRSSPARASSADAVGSEKIGASRPSGVEHGGG
jgi:hypothetical protein